MNSIRQFFALMALLLLGTILGASIYESVVLAPNFVNDVPNSLEHFRLFMRRANPGTFFRVVAPMAQVALLVCVIMFWKFRAARWWYVLALVTLAAGDVVTFVFHYPRNHLLFHAPLTQPVPTLVAAAQEWGTGNIGRVLLVVISAFAAAWGMRASLFAPVPSKRS